MYLAALFEFIMGEFRGPMEMTYNNVNFQDKDVIDSVLVSPSELKSYVYLCMSKIGADIYRFERQETRAH